MRGYDIVSPERSTCLKAEMVVLAMTTGLLYGVAQAAPTGNAIFPADAGVVDVTRPPYDAKGDGKTDATKAIQKALDDHPNSNRIIYLSV